MRLGISLLIGVCLCVGACSPDDNGDLSRLDLDVFHDNKTGGLYVVGRPSKITDGDTIVLANIIKIRMNGIDAPEHNQTRIDENGSEYPCGQHATEHLKQIIGTDRVQCRMHKYDRYGRCLMTCYKSDGTDINARMVRDGYAFVSTYNPDIYLMHETYARENNQGLWRGRMRHPHCVRHQTRTDKKTKTLCPQNKYYTGWGHGL